MRNPRVPMAKLSTGGTPRGKRDETQSTVPSPPRVTMKSMWWVPGTQSSKREARSAASRVRRPGPSGACPLLSSASITACSTWTLTPQPRRTAAASRRASSVALSPGLITTSALSGGSVHSNLTLVLAKGGKKIWPFRRSITSHSRPVHATSWSFDLPLVLCREGEAVMV